MSASSEFLDVFLAIEHLNRRIGEATAGSNTDDFNRIVDTEIAKLKRGSTSDATVIRALARAGIESRTSRDTKAQTLSKLDQLLRAPATGTSRTAARPVRLATPTQAEHTINVYDLHPLGLGLSTRAMPGLPAKLKGVTATLNLIEDLIDPVPTLSEYAVRAQDTPDALVFHVLQEWIASTFDVEDSDPTRTLVGKVCRRLNELFFGSAQPTRSEVQSRESALIGLPLLLQEIEEVLRPGGLNAERAALGFYAVLRVSRILRPYRAWLDRNSFDRLAEGQEPRPKWPMLFDAVSAVRAFESGYFKNRLFGEQSTIKGLSYVFKGGVLLPLERGHVTLVSGPAGSGKSVFALQTVADVALRGGFGVYLSFEETTGALVDRIDTFGLRDDTRFRIIPTSIDCFAQALDQKINPDRGLLVLVDCTQSEDEGPDSRNGAGTEDKGKIVGDTPDHEGPEDDTFWLEPFLDIIEKSLTSYERKALVIDSLNALPLASLPDTTDDHDDPVARRRVLRELLDRIRARNIRCIGIGEVPTDGVLERVGYLADTVIEMGWNQTHARRFLEVSKCRTQDYHPGAHLYRISDGRGGRIYPSLASTRSTIRKRGRASLRDPRTELIVNVANGDKVSMLTGRSILLSGPAGTGKSELALQLVVSPAAERVATNSTKESGFLLGPSSAPRGVLALTFSTPEFGFERRLEHFKLDKQWKDLPFSRVRWYSPGESLSGGQIIADLLSVLAESMRVGCPLERILIDDLEAAEYFLPSLQQDALFWPTLIELAATEALTTVFVVRTDRSEARSIEAIRQAVDYSLEMVRDGEHTVPYLEKDNGVWAHPHHSKSS